MSIDQIEDNLIGRILDGKYRLESKIGSSSMGSLYYATQVHLGMSVVIKIIDPQLVTNQEALERFRRLARTARTIHHPNAAAILDFEVTNERTCYIVSEFCAGVSLRTLLNNQGRLSEARVVSIVKEICKALEYVHNRNIIHQDLKPENVIINSQNNGTNIAIKITDFCLATFKSNPTVQGQAIGTPAYMSPEQAQGIEVDRLTDIYSLGAMFYEMLTGELPFKASNPMALMLKHIHARPRPLREIRPELTPELERLVMQMLAKRPPERPQAAQELVDRLELTKENTYQYIPPTMVVEEENMGPLNEIIIGNYFAFVGKECFEHPEVKSLLSLLGSSVTPKPSIASLVGQGELELFGKKFPRYQLETADLVAVVSDKMLYRYNQETITLVVLTIAKSNDTVDIEIVCNGQLVNTIATQLPHGDINGRMGTLKLTDLPPGDYTARLKGTKCETNFTIAEYQLAPLTAEYQSRSYSNEEFSFTAKLETYGIPLVGEISVELVDKGRVIAQQRVATTEPGILKHQVTLKGEGPFTLNFMVVASPDKTATLPIVGSRTEERRNTVVCELGRKVEASLLPLPEAECVRGIFLQTTSYTNTPFAVENEIGSEAQITARLAAEYVKIAVVDPLNNNIQEHEFINVSAGQTLSVPIPKPYGYILIGAFANGQPWEGWAVVIHPSNLALNVSVPNIAIPSSEIKINLTTNRPDTDVPVFLLIKDRRLISIDTLQNSVARGVKQHIEMTTKSMVIGKPEKRAKDITYIATAVDAHQLPSPIADVEYFFMIEGGPKSGQRINLTNQKQTYIVGRAPVCDIVINDPSVSLRHAKFFYEGNNWKVEDLASHNGIFINGNKISSATSLQTGQTITIGKATSNIKLRFHIQQNILIPPPVPHPTVYPGAVPPGGYDNYDNERVRRSSAPPMPPQSMPSAMPMPVSAAKSSSLLGSLSNLVGSAIPTGQASNVPRSVPPAAPPSVTQPSPMMKVASEVSSKSASLSGGSPPIVEGGSGLTPHSEADAPVIRADFPEVIFAEVVSVRGSADIEISLGDAITDYTVEAFALDGLDWQLAETSFASDKALFTEASVPPYVHPQDFVLGTLSVRVKSGLFSIRVTIDGTEIPIWLNNEQLAHCTPIQKQAAEIRFPVHPGVLRVETRDLSSGELDITEQLVNEPGKFVYLVRRPKMLEAGQQVSHTEPGIKKIKVLSGIEKPFKVLVKETANYAHKCCEQTASKIVASITLFFKAANDQERDKAEAVIIAGLEREKTMWLRGQGFKSYPESTNEVSYWSVGACNHLINLQLLRNAAPERKRFMQVVEDAWLMVQDTARAHKIEIVPSKIDSLENAYKILKNDPLRAAETIEYAKKHVITKGNECYAQEGNITDKTSLRRVTCFAAATLLSSQEPTDKRLALQMANWIFQQFDSNGRLYSTYDSAGAITLLSELERAKVLSDKAELKINGQLISLAEAATYQGEIQSVEVISGYVMIEIERQEEEAWDSFKSDLPLTISFAHQGHTINLNSLTPGQSFDLKVKLEKGYQEGDLLMVCLPACLARIVGGGQVKMFQLDFQGHNELSVPLVALAPTLSASSQHNGEPEPTGLFAKLKSFLTNLSDSQQGRQHWALAVRNMFNEDRAASSGVLTLAVKNRG